MTILDEFRRDEPKVLDRLVDGELGSAERRELLAGLDDEPGAWRRCALAFLEAQSWRWQMTRFAAEPLVAPSVPLAGKRSTPGAAPWKSWLAVAAGLLVAFGAGRQFAPSTPTTISTDAPRSTTGAADPSPQLAVADDLPWQEVTLVPLDGSASQDPIRLRVSNDGDASRSDGNASIATPLVNQLQENGWEVQRAQRWLPIEMSDGRRMVVPIEQVDIRRPDVVKF